MKRKDFLKKGLASSVLIGTSVFTSASISEDNNQKQESKDNMKQMVMGDPEEIIIERPIPGKPHKGKVLLAIQAHSDDIPLFAGGTVAKLMDEGYTGYLLLTSNDCIGGKYQSCELAATQLLRISNDCIGDYMGNFQDNIKIAKFYGMEKAYNFMYPHHQMDSIQIQDLKGRLIFLFRLLKVDTIVCWDPWEHYEENPDHIATAHAVEAARWMAGSSGDYPEHLDAGLIPHSPGECYYYSRDSQRANRIVDISNYIDKKAEVNLLNTTKGPAGLGQGKKLKDQLARDGKQLPLLGNDDKMANFNYAKYILCDIDSRRLNCTTISNKELGERYGIEWAERFHYIGPLPNKLEQYIKEHAIAK